MTTFDFINPRVFDPSSIDPETAKFNSGLERLMSNLPPSHTRTPQELREEIESGNGWMGRFKQLPEARDRVVSAAGLSVPVRMVVPPEVNGVYLHMHGGGFVLMRARHFDELLAATAKNSRVAVVSVDYRLAPEHPYPAAADDCETAALWLMENVQKEFGTRRLIIGGESAGANLAAVTLNRMRDKHGFTGFYGANLVFGCYDISMTPSQRNWGDREFMLSTPTIEWFNRHYLNELEKQRDPDVSPLYANLSGLPPALFTVGTLDPLLDDSLFMHARWLAAGNSSELAVYPGGAHMFTAFPLKMAKEANSKIFGFISAACEPGAVPKY
ncbi:MAG: alpha/beta hydrolase [Deltaproteobacteria bacterium HGW-Deltaproteobacteria-15]|jgi:acetyl esterase/lipase|nr:MAG: alpha/beta hydrolase [Deltaproteobacteria bacterium HGW-Deltaproteobacteria-15]